MCWFKACIWPAINIWKSLPHTCLKTQSKWESIKYMFSSQRTNVAVLFLDKIIIHILTRLSCAIVVSLFFSCNILCEICNMVKNPLVIVFPCYGMANHGHKQFQMHPLQYIQDKQPTVLALSWLKFSQVLEYCLIFCHAIWYFATIAW